MMIKTEYGLKVAKELKEVDKQALVTAIVDELKEYDEKYRQHGWLGAMKKTGQKARVLMGLAYSEFMADERLTRICVGRRKAPGAVESSRAGRPGVGSRC